MAARPAVKRPAGRPADAPARPIVRNLNRGEAAYRIDWDVRTTYDFVFSLSGDAGSTDDLPAADREWLVATRKSLDPEAQAGIANLFENELAIHAGVLLVDLPTIRTSADVVDLITDTSPRDLMTALLADDHHDADLAAVLARAIDGDAKAVDELAETLPEYHRQGRLELLKDPVLAKSRILGVLQAWQPKFAEIEARVGRILERDYDSRAADRERLAPADLIETTTGGLRYLPEPGISRIILAPSYFSRPYNFLMDGRDWRFFGYPVADSALDPREGLTPPLSVVRLHRALGDETRL
ncbi:MAG TPA: hypothetical protein VH440_04445, partial [Candidatus Limnocylindrales bacterium]